MHVGIGKRAVPASAAVVIALAAAACGAGTTSSGSGGGGGSAATVTAQNFAFNPSTLTIPSGTQVTITFTNKDSATHSLTFDDNSQSVQADGGSSQTLVFTAPSSGTTISFHCKFHASMHGTINVGGGGGGAGSSSSSSSGGGYGY